MLKNLLISVTNKTDIKWVMSISRFFVVQIRMLEVYHPKILNSIPIERSDLSRRSLTHLESSIVDKQKKKGVINGFKRTNLRKNFAKKTCRKNIVLWVASCFVIKSDRPQILIFASDNDSFNLEFNFCRQRGVRCTGKEPGCLFISDYNCKLVA